MNRDPDLASRTLFIGNDVENDRFLEIISEKKIKILSMPANWTIHDGTIQQLTDIEFLDISFCGDSKVTMSSIKKLTENGTLKTINVTNNTNFSLSDVSQLEEMGIRIIHGFYYPTANTT